MINKKLDSLTQQLAQGNRCKVCGAMATETHHIVPRACMTLRYDISNFMFLCHNCHQRITDGKIDDKDYVNYNVWLYLQERKNTQYKDFLIEQGLTKQEHHKQVEKYFKELINESNS